MKKIFLAIILILFLSSSAHAEDVEVSWEYDSDLDNVTGFKIYASTESGEYTEDDVLAEIEYDSGKGEYSTVETLDGEEGTTTTYYFVATAYNDSQESDYSNEVSKDIVGSPSNLKCSIKTE